MKYISALLAWIKGLTKTAQPCQPRTEPQHITAARSLFAEPQEPILYTFYNIGPTFLTYSYPVDTDVYKEIYEEGGIIGPDKYLQYEGALHAMKENDNDYFTEDEHQECAELLKQDLLLLAGQHGMHGAYSTIGSVCRNYDERNRYWKKGADLGNKESLVCYAIHLYTNGRTADGFNMLKRGADMGCNHACLMVAISYHYGTLSEINIKKAVEYYLKVQEEEFLFFKYVNLGTLLLESGYYWSAFNMFNSMEQTYHKNSKELREFGDIDKYLDNLKKCQKLLMMPYEERAKRMVIQIHDRKLDRIFCKDNTAPLPSTNELVDLPKQLWIPTSEQIYVAHEDIEEHKNLPAVVERPVNKHEDYLFISIPVKLNSSRIHGTQSQLIFLEKNCHVALNKYIQEHLIPIRAALKQLGYSLKYIPAHTHDLTDATDIIGSYHNDYGKRMWDVGMSLFYPQDFSEQEYWEAIVPTEKLPDDCAGFLRYVPNMQDLMDNSNFEFILFPYQPGTDWQRAFREFFALMRSKPIIPIFDKEKPTALLPSGSFLQITEDYEFQFKDNADTVLATIKMPTLSKVLYILLLNHPEGITLKNMIDHHAELLEIYQKMAAGKAKAENIDTLCDPTNNSASEKLSRIKSAFTQALGEKYKDDLPAFLPQGKRGEAIVVSVERGRVKTNNISTL